MSLNIDEKEELAAELIAIIRARLRMIVMHDLEYLLEEAGLTFEDIETEQQASAVIALRDEQVN